MVIYTVENEMRSPNKLTPEQMSFITSIPVYATKSSRKFFNQIKNNLLDEIKKTFGNSWYRMKEGTQKAFDFVCFLSVERGYFYASASKTAAKHDISEKTIYRLLKTLMDEGILAKRNFDSTKHNGLGNAIYFFKKHPYFNKYEDFFGFESHENHDENIDENPEIAETPCVTSELRDNECSTYSLPSITPKETKDIHPNVQNFTRYVPKVINEMFQNKLGNKLRTVWVKLNQAYKHIKHPMLTKDSLYIIAKNFCFQLIKSKKHLKMNEDQLAGYAYKTALNMFYEFIADEFLAEIELNSPEIDLEYDFSTNETYFLLPPHKHGKMHEGYERESSRGMFSDLSLSIHSNEIVYSLENQIIKANAGISYTELKERVLISVAADQDETVVNYIKDHYEELTFNNWKLEQEQEQMISEYRELAMKLSNKEDKSIQSELPF